MVDFDGVLFLAMFTALLFLDQFATYGAVAFSLVGVIYVLRHREAIRAVMGEQWFFLLFPALAILSTIWSATPPETFKHSLEFAFTAICGLLVPSARNQRSAIYGLFVAFAFYTIVSLAVGTMVPAGAAGDVALSGLDASKNAQASA
ncbi:MAG: hypothetical protein ACREFW_04910, partial [Rhizomicrobium sp.]